MIQQTLQQTFGFEHLRSGQQTVIENVMAGHSSAAIFPTGSGKSLCYQLPATLLPHLTLVISPLLALMKDQLEFLAAKGIPSASIDSSQTREEAQRIMADVKNGQIKVLMISVERLKNERFRQFIRQVPISLLVVDEAHCISEWGHNFRPDYLKLPNYQQELNIPQVLLLTATATPAVIEDMQTKFAIAPEHVTVTGFYRSNLDISVIPCDEQNKQQQLSQLLLPEPNLPTIVYVTQQQTAEHVASALHQQGINAQAYHAGMGHELREQIQNRFMQGHVDCVVATIAFGMGVDKADIRRVIHFDLPKSVENYAQEIGRAGRDGNLSHCIVLGNLSGLTVLENFVYGDTPEPSSIQTVVDQLRSNAPEWQVITTRLSKESNIRQLPLKTLLVYLELSQEIEAKYSFFADYRFKFVMPQQQIIEQFSGERKHFIEAIFQSMTKARVWCQIDFEVLWMDYQAERSRVVAALDYFDQQGWIELESKQLTDVYQVLNNPTPIDSVVLELAQLFEQKELKDIQRIHHMLQLFQAESCISQQLAHYFADHNAPQQCGHCSVCRGQVAQFAPIEGHGVDDEQVKQWIEPLLKPSNGLMSNPLLTRFLCGITTPKLTQIKASKMSGFGALSHVSFGQVLKQVERVTGGRTA